ncbi:hypothetical protein Tco_0006864 [Tanacetum coccineum]
MTSVGSDGYAGDGCVGDGCVGDGYVGDGCVGDGCDTVVVLGECEGKVSVSVKVGIFTVILEGEVEVLVEGVSSAYLAYFELIIKIAAVDNVTTNTYPKRLSLE